MNFNLSMEKLEQQSEDLYKKIMLVRNTNDFKIYLSRENFNIEKNYSHKPQNAEKKVKQTKKLIEKTNCNLEKLQAMQKELFFPIRVILSLNSIIYDFKVINKNIDQYYNDYYKPKISLLLMGYLKQLKSYSYYNQSGLAPEKNIFTACLPFIATKHNFFSCKSENSDTSSLGSNDEMLHFTPSP